MAWIPTVNESHPHRVASPWVVPVEIEFCRMSLVVCVTPSSASPDVGIATEIGNERVPHY